MKLKAGGGVIYTQQDISDLTGIPASTLATWIAAGAIPGPTVRQGVRRYYAESDKDKVVKAIGRMTR